MPNYKYLYKKYKTKYIMTKNLIQKGGSKNIILLVGTSSSGKTTISKFYENKVTNIFLMMIMEAKVTKNLWRNYQTNI